MVVSVLLWRERLFGSRGQICFVLSSQLYLYLSSFSQLCSFASFMCSGFIACVSFCNPSFLDLRFICVIVCNCRLLILVLQYKIAIIYLSIYFWTICHHYKDWWMMFVYASLMYEFNCLLAVNIYTYTLLHANCFPNHNL